MPAIKNNLCMEAADKVVKLWDVDNGELIQTLEGHTEGISDVAWSHDGDFLASASDDKTIWIWSIEEVRVAALFPPVVCSS